MDIFLLFIVLGFLIFIVRHLSNIKNDLNNLQNDVNAFREEVEQYRFPSKGKDPESAASVFKTPEKIVPKPVIEAEIKTSDFQTKESSVEKQKFFAPLRTEKPVRQTEPSFAYTPLPSSKTGWFENWLRDNPDIEKFIGENLINKIGIGVLVLGIAFFVKYAIDQEWINKVGRVCIGLFCGVILTWLANRLRKNYHAFSSVLAGGGIVIYYFTIAFAFHQYHLIGQGAAFGIMVVITVFSVLLSILYDRLELGILATVGGFITPFLVSQGDGNWLVLFTYISILNAGLIILAYYKRWRVINFIAFFFTEVIYLSWIITRAGSPGFSYSGIFVFGALFYLMFILMNVVHHVSRGSKLKAFDFIILLSVNLAFYGACIYLMGESGYAMYKGLFTACLGIINLLLAYLFFKRSKADKKFIYLLIGITLSFISLTAPVQLRGHYITMFWSAEMVVLLWLYQKSFITLLKITVLLLCALMIVSLIMDWSEIYSHERIIYPILLNKGWVTGCFSSLSMFLVYQLMRKEAGTYFINGITNRLIRQVFLTGSVVLFFFSGALEIFDQFTKRFPSTEMQFVYLQLYLVIFVLVLFIITGKFRMKMNPGLFILMPASVIAVYILNISNTHFTEIQVLIKAEYKNYFPASWISALLLLFLIRKTIQYIRINKTLFAGLSSMLAWPIAIACLIILSAEIRNLFVWLDYSNPSSVLSAETIFDKAGLTIVWGLSSFIMIWLGMAYRYKTLRIIALVVFGITLIKLFVFDIQNITPAGKIIAFILLGVLLLIISFMYQRLKKIIIDDTKDTN